MNDTSPEIAHLMHERYAAMDPVERFLIGVQMFETARTFVLASLPKNLNERERRIRLCERLYGDLAFVAYADGNPPPRSPNV